ncbi:uncharacterized protein LOC762660 [Strongylocentrotus purpuratus]|uniref:Uncharacterized protein n=1 Tax=Strongylocentrotus purpuratus TaxID=7668 RepID=A0A7M7HEB5_STRPU|nr:uncharacterized protein LOC762660 [Strongylocentrotus purpuratus]|eukprot:XP_011662096.1 PREDICTED: uncharacterized protein LOC762660 [Strongylocentrotus purpuratus]
MASLHIITLLLLATASSVQAGLSDQTFSWVDLSAGVAGTVGICVFFVGIGFLIHDLGFREYLAEVRTNGETFAQDLPDFILSEPTLIGAKSLSELDKVDIDDEIDPPSDVGVVIEDEMPVYDGMAEASTGL